MTTYKRLPLKDDLVGIEEVGKLILSLESVAEELGYAPWQDLDTDVGTLFFAKYGQNNPRVRLLLEDFEGNVRPLSDRPLSVRQSCALTVKKASNNKEK